MPRQTRFIGGWATTGSYQAGPFNRIMYALYREMRGFEKPTSIPLFRVMCVRVRIHGSPDGAPAYMDP